MTRTNDLPELFDDPTDRYDAAATIVDAAMRETEAAIRRGAISDQHAAEHPLQTALTAFRRGRAQVRGSLSSNDTVAVTVGAIRSEIHDEYGH